MCAAGQGLGMQGASTQKLEVKSGMQLTLVQGMQVIPLADGGACAASACCSPPSLSQASSLGRTCGCRAVGTQIPPAQTHAIIPRVCAELPGLDALGCSKPAPVWLATAAPPRDVLRLPPLTGRDVLQGSGAGTIQVERAQQCPRVRCARALVQCGLHGEWPPAPCGWRRSGPPALRCPDQRRAPLKHT